MWCSTFILPSLRPYRVHRPQQTSERPPPQTTSASIHTDVAGRVNGSEIELKGEDDVTVNAYFVKPKAETDSKAGVVLLSDINGYTTADTRRVADLLANNSLPTIVPDLFRGNAWPDGKPADDTYEAWRQQHPYDRVHADIRAAVKGLHERGYGEPLGLIGFCFGGGRLMHEISLVERGVNPSAAAAFYPTRFDAEETGRKAKCPLLFVSGDCDPLVPLSIVDTLRGALEDENEVMPDCEVIVAEGAGHAFVHRCKSEDDHADSEFLLQKAAHWLSRFLLFQGIAQEEVVEDTEEDLE